MIRWLGNRPGKAMRAVDRDSVTLTRCLQLLFLPTPSSKTTSSSCTMFRTALSSTLRPAFARPVRPDPQFQPTSLFSYRSDSATVLCNCHFTGRRQGAFRSLVWAFYRSQVPHLAAHQVWRCLHCMCTLNQLFLVLWADFLRARSLSSQETVLVQKSPTL